VKEEGEEVARNSKKREGVAWNIAKGKRYLGSVREEGEVNDGTKLKGEDLIWNSEKGKEIPLKCEGGLLGQWEKELAGNGEERGEEAWNCEEERGNSKWRGRARGSLEL
jgi:hypothetical protein